MWQYEETNLHKGRRYANCLSLQNIYPCVHQYWDTIHTINFSSGTNGKLMVLSMQILKYTRYYLCSRKKLAA